MNVYHETALGRIVLGRAQDALAQETAKSIDLIVTSPPFGLVRKKEYGNVSADEYLDWFRPFATQFKRLIKESGSLVIDIGGAWNAGQPTRHLYHFKLLIMLCEEFGFHLAQEFYWWNPSKLPTPAEWVTVRRVRVKDAINCIWWLSPSPWPKASNRRVLQPYSDAMQGLLKNGYKAKKRPSGHDISDKFNINNGAAIPPNFLAISNTESNSFYLRYCNERGIKPHPARYPAALPEYFVRMLTDEGDVVVDPFAGSCVTGEVCERLRRRWLCCELVEEYLTGAVARFTRPRNKIAKAASRDTVGADGSSHYRVSRPDVLWDDATPHSLPQDGGKKRALPSKAEAPRRKAVPANGEKASSASGLFEDRLDLHAETQ